MKEIIKIEVTQEDIDLGIRCNSEACPVALAVLRVLPEFKSHISVGTYMLYLWESAGEGKEYNEALYSIVLPEIARNMIRNFDTATPVMPFSFDIVLD